MHILITNDDGYQAKGIQALVDIMKQFGKVTVIAPKKHQSNASARQIPILIHHSLTGKMPFLWNGTMSMPLLQVA